MHAATLLADLDSLYDPKGDPMSLLTGKKVTDGELAMVNLIPDAFHGEWNYTIGPDP